MWQDNKDDTEGDSFTFGGQVEINVLETPGHSKGSLSFLISVDGIQGFVYGGSDSL